MVKNTIICMLALLCSVVCPASNIRCQSKKQTLPDLSGTWKLDRAKGNYVKKSGLKRDADFILVIFHAEPEIKVTRKVVWKGQEDVLESIYYTDGRGEDGYTLIDELKGKSKTVWNGNKLVTKFSVSIKNKGQADSSFDVVQEWKLSADGKTLTQTQRISNYSGPPYSLSPPNKALETLIMMIDPTLSSNETTRIFKRIS